MQRDLEKRKTEDAENISDMASGFLFLCFEETCMVDIDSSREVSGENAD